ncbi:solute carrier family 12 member 3-like [Sander lucioperca]|uniref:solute carrier family 12 member 3-like n=1 Tax=Sander lucioperca TaxID=283035 RepID=UPI00125D30DC|nr:solute carrier family 12 member 3-like [Sander lucioperca]XP_031160233.1 solute carrier family 12 member 3-like [Sander lucioperca]
MGQLTSKRGGLHPGVPNVQFSTNDEGPPRYSSHGLPPTIVISDVESSASERRGSRVELRRSSVYSTLDLVPQLGHYTRTLHQQTGSRPSLDALRKAFEEKEAGIEVPTTDSGDGSLPDSGTEPSKAPPKKAPARFGWFIGVMMRCMLNIWGVILFLRVTVITSQAGIVLMWVIIGLSVMVTTITGLSISAIATNGRVASGGTYFMISRSLGYELGAPIGLVFSFANALACALNTVGFSIVVKDLMRDYNTTIVDDVNDVRIIGVITLVILLMIVLAGMEWESKTQILFFIILLVSFSDYLVGTIIPPSQEKQAKGIFRYNKDIFISNLTPDWRGPDGNFFRMFSIFFPGATGILSGVNICGDLKDPASAIPKGTLGAIFFTTLSYLVLSVTSGASVVRDASGNMSDFVGGNITSDCVGLGCQFGWNFTKCTLSQTCKFGLANTSKVMGLLSGSYYLIIAGVFAATLSSALGFLVSAPKVFQCLCKDKIYPYIGVFAKGYGKNNEPFRAYILCFFIAVGLVLIGDLNTIAALNSNLFMCSYALINFSCFHASFTNAPGWRPMFHYYNKWLALFAAAIAVLLMFLFTWWAALFVLSFMAILFIYVTYNKPNVNWGSSVQAGSYNMALSYSVALSSVNDHVKNFRPQCLVLTGPPNQRPALVDFVDSFTKHASLMICGDIIMNQDRQTRLQDDTDRLVKWMNKRKVRSFYSPFTADSLRVGARNLLQASGLGKLKPNILVLGFKSNWRDSSPESIEDYINTIYDTFDTNYSLCILRMVEGLDVSDQFDFEVNQGFEPEESVEKEDQQSSEKKPADDIPDEDKSDQIKTVFQIDQGKKTIDIYWIADDGGLTLLVPYLLTRRKRWQNCKVRVFIVGDEQNMEESRTEMLRLLDRFRFGFKDVTVMTDSEKHPQAKNLERFEDSVASFRLYDEQQDGVLAQELRENAPWKISDKEFEAFRQKSETKVKLNEIIRRNSIYAGLVVVSLPVPHSDCTSALYMAWLDTLTCGLHCPVVLIRGNQEDVLTFYCQ